MWTEEEVAYLQQNIIGNTYDNLAKMLNAKFGTTRKADAVKKWCNNHGITNYCNLWTEEEKRFLREHCHLPYKELAAEVSKVKGVNRTEIQTRNMCYQLGLHNGRDTKYQKGHEPSGRTLPIGAERTYDGRKTYVKVSNGHKGDADNKHGHEKNYRLKHELIWEGLHGPIPPKHIVIFADGDRNNFEPDNLVCIPNAVKQMMNAKGWQFEDIPEMRRNAITWCELQIALRN